MKPRLPCLLDFAFRSRSGGILSLWCADEWQSWHITDLYITIYLSQSFCWHFVLNPFKQPAASTANDAMFFFLPSILLSGFMFPFYGMPRWAQILGDCLPLTHYLRIVRGIMLKGNDFVTAMPEVGALLLFTVIIGIIAMLRYKQTL